ncbi:MAG: CDP-glycerol glycerophosphotransferase family protein [Oscillospiraceae bacterium]|jgi:CDP-glycerol glycerophosphotransferase|nr:CDP-glycerol glycerophosphotransferase family protein [Oscillospiraceae bacterium]
MKQKIQAFAVSIAKTLPWLRPLLRAVRRVLLRLWYRVFFCVGTRVDPKIILFESFLGRFYSDNPRAIYEYMRTDARFADYTFVWSARDVAKISAELDGTRAQVVRFQSRAYYKVCAQAGVWVFNSRALDWLARRRGQQYIQTWHGTPLKTLGHDVRLDGNAMNSVRETAQKWDVDTRQYTALLSYSPFVSEKFTTAFGLEKLGKTDILWEVGAPRNDRLVRAKADESALWKARLGIEPHKKVILYAPTWRDDQHDAKLGYTYQNQLDFSLLREALGDEWVVLFRAHYFVANSFDFAAYGGFVVDVSGEADIAQLYPAADMLITDYSSVFFDYALLERPMVFYMYDLAQYKDEVRGFYFSPDELPGRITQTPDELIDAVRAAARGETVPTAQLEAFRAKFLPWEDGGAAARVAARCVAMNN